MQPLWLQTCLAASGPKLISGDPVPGMPIGRIRSQNSGKLPGLLPDGGRAMKRDQRASPMATSSNLASAEERGGLGDP